MTLDGFVLRRSIRLTVLRPDTMLDIGVSRGIDVDPARRPFGRTLLNFGLDSSSAESSPRGSGRGTSRTRSGLWAVPPGRGATPVDPVP